MIWKEDLLIKYTIDYNFIMVFNALEQTLPIIDPPIVVGLSGGSDSMVLLHAMKEKNLAPIAAHFNHKLREESDQDAEFIREYCLRLELPYREGEGDVTQYSKEFGLSIEEAARILRYRFLFDIAETEHAGAVAVGHHSDDQVETIIMNLLRGTGTKGLTGMQIVTYPNPWSETIPLVRPLLEVTKTEIMAFQKEYDLPYLEDPSNLDIHFHRNNIRHTVIPRLEEVAPGLKKRLLQTSQILSSENQALDHFTNKAWEECLNSQGGSYIQLTRETFLNFPTAIQRRLIRKALQSLRPDYRELSFPLVEAAMTFFRNPAQKSTNWVAKVNLSQSAKWVVFSTWETDVVKDQFPQLQGSREVNLPKEGEISLGNGWYFNLQTIEYSADQYDQLIFPGEDFRVWVDQKSLGDDPTLRVRQEGDTINPFGMGGKSMKISDLMINEKIPALYREEWPLLSSADKILWVPGGRLSQDARVTKKTEGIVELAFVRK
jgi:tRNA(Ile)-lysidine synthase